MRVLSSKLSTTQSLSNFHIAYERHIKTPLELDTHVLFKVLPDICTVTIAMFEIEFVHVDCSKKKNSSAFNPSIPYLNHEKID